MSSGQYVNRAYARDWHSCAVSREKKRRDSEPAPVPEVGKRLALARLALRPKLTQIALAKMAGLDQGALSKFENGQRGLEAPNLIALLRAAAEAGISVDGFVLRGVGSPLQTGPLTLAQDPAFRDAVVELARRIEEDERKK